MSIEPVAMSPEDLQEEKDFLDILIALRGAGIKELEAPIPIETKNGVTVVLKISNVSTEQEILSLLAAEEFKGHHWMQRIKCEILSRAISSINGVSLDSFEYVQDPNDSKQSVQVRKALRDLLISWGPETLQVLWKIYMIHCQNIEDNLLKSFPDTVTMTEYEKRFYERTVQLMEEFSNEIAEELSHEDLEGSETKNAE